MGWPDALVSVAGMLATVAVAWLMFHYLFRDG